MLCWLWPICLGVSRLSSSPQRNRRLHTHTQAPHGYQLGQQGGSLHYTAQDSVVRLACVVSVSIPIISSLSSGVCVLHSALHLFVRSFIQSLGIVVVGLQARAAQRGRLLLDLLAVPKPNQWCSPLFLFFRFWLTRTGGWLVKVFESINFVIWQSTRPGPFTLSQTHLLLQFGFIQSQFVYLVFGLVHSSTLGRHYDLHSCLSSVN